MLPSYDEYFIGFKDRAAILERVKTSSAQARDRALSAHIIVIKRQVVGGWKRRVEKDAVVVSQDFLTSLENAEYEAVQTAAERYGWFLGKPEMVVRRV